MVKDDNVLNLMLVGQVLQNPSKISQIICEAAVMDGVRFEAVDETFQVQDVTPEICFLRFGKGFVNPFIKKGSCNLMVGMLAGETARSAADYLELDGMVIVNMWDVKATVLPPGMEEYPTPEQSIDLLMKITKNIVRVPAASMAIEVGGYYLINAVMLGALMATNRVPVSLLRIRETIDKLVHKWQREKFTKAFEAGFEYVSKQYPELLAISMDVGGC